MRPTFPRSFAVSCVAVVAAGCGSAGERTDEPDSQRVCDVTLSADGFELFQAAAGGGVVGVVEGDHLVLQRLQGEGCELQAVRTPVAAARFYDVDDRGNLYVGPFEVLGRGPVSTLLPDSPFGDIITRVSPDNELVNLANSPRGIWEGGVAPDGTSLWLAAVSSSGIYALDDDGTATPAFAPPDSLWQQRPAVLTDSGTFWSVGVGGAYALVKADENGGVDVGDTVIDFGNGPEEGTLRRCGSDVCGVFASAVIVYGDDGSVAFTVDHDDIANADEAIENVSGNALGLYITLAGGTVRRVVFVARS